MLRKISAALIALTLPYAPAILANAQDRAVITVDAAHPGAKISPTMFGIFFEDINFAADGGIYPERIKNRSFEFDTPLAGWRIALPSTPKGRMDVSQGEIHVEGKQPLNASNPHYLSARIYAPNFTVSNAGFRGVGVESGAEYRFSAYVRSRGPKAIRGVIVDGKGQVLGSGTLSGFNGEWKRYETIIKTTGSVAKGKFNLIFEGKGDIDIDMVSLFPVDTFKQRPNGLRKDLAQLLADMHPGFLRFPGGCIVEGRELATRYRWKLTVGDIAERKTIINRWNDEFDNKPAPDYFQSFGLGFYEYFQLAEDIGASPLPILNCGMACQFNSNETAKIDEIKDYIRDAMDLIEFANGPVTTPWGKLRAEMGHREPFHLKMLGVGNEQWGPRYMERYKLFSEALKSSHPEIQLVVSSGPSSDGEQFDYLWSNWKASKADIVDEHYYMSPEWFLQNSGRYDHYDRSGPKVFAGEYAAQTVGMARSDNRNNWRGAIAEAAFMTGLERNADVVIMASYAPLFAHVDAWQWTPDAIWFDNLRSYGTPNYYVQKVFANNVGSRIVPSMPQAENDLYTSASIDDKTHELIVKVVNASPKERSTELRLGEVKVGKEAKVTTLASADLTAENNFDHPTNVSPKDSTIAVESSTIPVTLEANSVTVYRIPLQ